MVSVAVVQRHIGRFKIDIELLDINPALFRAIMGECCIVRCEQQYHSMAFEYIAVSPHFEAVPASMTVPWYDVVASDDGGVIEFKQRL